MSLKITAPKSTGLSFAERGLLDYMLRTVDADGLFKQHVDDIAEAGHVSHGTAFSLQKNLIARGYVEMVEKPRRDWKGRFSVPAVLRPKRIDSVNMKKIDSVEIVETTQQSPSQQTPKILTELTRSHLVKLTGNTVHSHEHRELSVESGDGSRAGRTVVPTDSVVPAKDDVLADWRAGRKAKAEAIRGRNAQ